MKGHTFIFSPGIWEGKGIISFSMADDELPFTMKWKVSPQENDQITFSQELDIQGYEENMYNHFILTDQNETTFAIHLENEMIGAVNGKGLVDPQIIAWEFRHTQQGFEGFEVYVLQPDGSYTLRAEFTAGEGLRTFVKGVINKK